MGHKKKRKKRKRIDINLIGMSRTNKTYKSTLICSK